jgi:hypothetical protein
MNTECQSETEEIRVNFLRMCHALFNFLYCVIYQDTYKGSSGPLLRI